MRPLSRLGEKLEIVPRSAMLTSRYAPVRRAGRLAFTLLMLSSVRHAKWIYSAGRSVPRTTIGCRPPVPVCEGDVALCKRLIDAYSQAKASGPGRTADGMWAWIGDVRQHRLADTLDHGDPTKLAQLMASMFAEDFVLGMAAGPLIRSTRSGPSGRAWGLKCLDGLVSLAESLGTVAVENPEQGSAGPAFDSGLEALVQAVEDNLDVRLDFPEVGAPCGLAIGDRLISPDMPDQVYAAACLKQHLQASSSSEIASNPDCLEIGGGYGSMCYWFLRLNKRVGSYTIIDLPLVNVIQAYFLGKALGTDEISLFGESAARVRVLPTFALPDLSPVDIVANKDSMPEMPEEAMMDYLSWTSANCRSLFYSYNQETASEFLGESQGIVHSAVARVGGFKRLSRNRAWIREGYVEELYEVLSTNKAHPPAAEQAEKAVS